MKNRAIHAVAPVKPVNGDNVATNDPCHEYLSIKYLHGYCMTAIIVDEKVYELTFTLKIDNNHNDNGVIENNIN